MFKYTFDEFKKIIEDKLKMDIYCGYDIRNFFTYDSHYEYTVTRTRNDENVIIEGLFSVEIPYCYDKKENEKSNDYYNRFYFDEKEYKPYSWSETEIKKILIPMTIETLYEKLQPCYRIKYLSNDNEHRKDCYYGKK